MKWLKRLRRRQQPETAAEATRAIRRHMAALGYDLSDHTDDEIQAGVLRFGEIVSASMFTTRDVVNAFAMLGEAKGEVSER